MIPPAILTPALSLLPRRTIRVGVTGLARAGKTAFLTSLAANLLALGAGRPVLPLVRRRIGTRLASVSVAAAGASPVPRFDHSAHLAALARDPPAWPERTNAASLLALDLVITRLGFGAALPPQRVRLELLDYPGEWLLDLPLLRTPFDTWSNQSLRRLEGRPEAAAFLAFTAGLPAGAAADEALALAGHRLFRDTLQRLRDSGLSLLQPGRFLMPAPGPEPAWTPFFPHRGAGGLHALLARRYDAYVGAVERDLADPLFGKLDRLVVLVDVLSALHAGPAAFEDMRAALAEAAGALRWRRSLVETAMALGRLRAPPAIVSRVVFAATKSDHVGDRQRENLAALLRRIAEPTAKTRAAYLAIAAVRCTEEIVWLLDDRPVSAVRGRVLNEQRPVRSFPGEVPHTPPDAAFWAHPFLELPHFEPIRPPDAGRGGVPNLGLDALLVALLDDVL